MTANTTKKNQPAQAGHPWSPFLEAVFSGKKLSVTTPAYNGLSQAKQARRLYVAAFLFSKGDGRG